MKPCRKCKQELQLEWKYCPMCGSFNRAAVYPFPSVRRVEEPLSPQDGANIRGIPWLEPEADTIERFYLASGDPIRFVRIRAFNEVFVNHKLCYRVMVVKFNPPRYKIFKTVPKVKQAQL